MLLDRSRPNHKQTFGDYLNDLGKRNGFANIRRFRSFLMESSKNKNSLYFFYYRPIYHVIGGVFIELGLDSQNESNCPDFLCFGCLNYTKPKDWVWVTESKVHLKCSDYSLKGQLLDGDVQKHKEKFCGIIKYSTDRLGLNFTPKEAGLYYADIYSKEEHDGGRILKGCPDYGQFKKICNELF